MDIESVRHCLRVKGYNVAEKINAEDIEEEFLKSGLTIWTNDKRVIILKYYINDICFYNWRTEDQVKISRLLDILPSRNKNNLYFLMVIDNDEVLSNKLKLEINRAEKDSKVCRKYVITNNEDMLRIPFLNDKWAEENASLDYEQLFMQGIHRVSDISDTVLKSIDCYFEKGESEINDCLNLLWKEGIDDENQ